MKQTISTVEEVLQRTGANDIKVLVVPPKLQNLLRRWKKVVSLANLVPVMRLSQGFVDGLHLQAEMAQKYRLAMADQVGRPVEPQYLGFRSDPMMMVFEMGDIKLMRGDSQGEWKVAAPNVYGTIYLADQHSLLNLLLILGRRADTALLDENTIEPEVGKVEAPTLAPAQGQG